MERTIIRKQMSFRLNADLMNRLQVQAREEKVSLNRLVEIALMDFAYSTPNETTIAAIKEARAGKCAGVLDMRSFETFVKSLDEIE